MGFLMLNMGVSSKVAQIIMLVFGLSSVLHFTLTCVVTSHKSTALFTLQAYLYAACDHASLGPNDQFNVYDTNTTQKTGNVLLSFHVKLCDCYVS